MCGTSNLKCNTLNLKFKTLNAETLKCKNYKVKFGVQKLYQS